MAIKLILHFDHFNVSAVEVPAQGVFVIGRRKPDKQDGRCDLELEQHLRRSLSLVSRRHLEIAFDLDRFVVRDLNSTNKTRLNGRELHPGMFYALDDGAILSLANDLVKIRVQVSRETDATPALRDAKVSIPVMIRQQEIAAISERLVNRQNVHLCGPNGIGKTEVLRVFSDPQSADKLLGARSFLCCYADMRSLPELSEIAVCALILVSLRDAAQRDPRCEIEVPWLDHMIGGLISAVEAGRPYPILRQAIERVSARALRTVLLLFDHFEDICEAGMQMFLSSLINLSHESRQGVLYMVATTDDFWHLAPSQEQVGGFSAFQDHLGAPLWLVPFAEEQAGLLVQSRNRKQPVDIVRLAMQLSGGWPSLLMSLLDALPGHGGAWCRQPLVHIITELFDPMYSESVSQKCELIWHDLDSDERKALQYLAAGKKTTDQQALARLTRKSLIKSHDRIELPRIMSPLLEHFVLQVDANPNRILVVDRASQHQGLWIDPKTGDVWVDGHNVTKKRSLSKLRYRLLKYLYDHPREVRSLDQIAEAVHPEDNEEGISDQSLTRLIKLLRDAIEPDPSRPRFIKNSAGRGYYCDPKGANP